MATSSFSKDFVVRAEKADEFVQEMTSNSPTLHKNFQSKLCYLTKDKKFRDALISALSK